MQDERIVLGIREDRSGPSFLDGCHKYGWLFSIVTTILMFIWFAAGQNARLDDVRHDVDLLKQQIFDLDHMTRGLRDIGK